MSTVDRPAFRLNRAEQEALQKLVVGSDIVCEYRAPDSGGEFIQWEKRRFKVVTISPNHDRRDPAKPLAKGEWVIEAYDFDRGAQATLYLGSMRGITVVDIAPTFAVVWIETDNVWRPGDELPAEFKISDIMTENVTQLVGESIRDGANEFLRKTGLLGQWAHVVPQAALAEKPAECEADCTCHAEATTDAPKGEAPIDPTSLASKVVSFQYPVSDQYGERKPAKSLRRVAVDKQETTTDGEVWIDGIDLDLLERRRFRLSLCEEIEPAGGDDYSVAWITIDDQSWLPGQPLPDEFEVEKIEVEGVSSIMAGVVADAANQMQVKCGERGRWCIVLESKVARDVSDDEPASVKEAEHPAADDRKYEVLWVQADPLGERILGTLAAPVDLAYAEELAFAANHFLEVCGNHEKRCKVVLLAKSPSEPKPAGSVAAEAVALPPLVVEIRDAETGELLKENTVPDPRAGYCREYNSLGRGRVAIPKVDRPHENSPAAQCVLLSVIPALAEAGAGGEGET